MAYDGFDPVSITAREIGALKQKNKLFSTHLIMFRFIFWDLRQGIVTIKNQIF